jgi:hypothetical protein
MDLEIQALLKALDVVVTYIDGLDGLGTPSDDGEE